MKITRNRECFPGNSMENAKTGGKSCGLSNMSLAVSASGETLCGRGRRAGMAAGFIYYILPALKK